MHPIAGGGLVANGCTRVVRRYWGLTAGAALKLPNTLLKSRILCRRREKRLEGASQDCRRHPRIYAGNGNHDEVARRVVVVSAVPKWHSAAAPADELRM